MKCPHCGGAVSYQGERSVECVTKGCVNYAGEPPMNAVQSFGGNLVAWDKSFDGVVFNTETDTVERRFGGKESDPWFEGKIPEGKALLFGGPRHGEMICAGETWHTPYDFRRTKYVCVTVGDDAYLVTPSGTFWSACDHCDTVRIGKRFAGVACRCPGDGHRVVVDPDNVDLSARYPEES